MKFNLNDYKGNYVMHCKTKEEAESFCRFLHQNGRKWRDGSSYLKDNKWDFYKANTIYYFNKGTYCDVEYTKLVQGYKILEWSDFMEDEETVSKFTLDDLKPGDFIKLKYHSECCVLFVYIYTNLDGGTVVFEEQHTHTKYTKFFHSDLTAVGESGSEYANDIMQVRRPVHPSDVCGNIFDDCKGCLLYAREKEEEMTLDEVCKALGRKIKIVAEHQSN